MIEIEGLEKTYRRFRRPPTVAVRGLDLEVPRGGVFGFLGPNGSGKTTTIRCLLGLARPTSGSIRVLGRAVPSQLPEVMASIGAVVDDAGFVPTMTAREHVRLLAGVDGIPRARADGALERVGLGPRAGDAVKGYSLGMRQRLALAVALLKDPELLVLDEPANGLDPAGMRDVRLLLRSLADEGRTVFLSSHLLSEVEQTCDRVAILSAGRCVLAGSVDDLLHARSGAWVVGVGADDVSPAVDALTRAGVDARPAGARAPELLVPGTIDGADITRVLATAGVYLCELRREESTLESLFFELTAVAA